MTMQVFKAEALNINQYFRVCSSMMTNVPQRRRHPQLVQYLNFCATFPLARGHPYCVVAAGYLWYGVLELNLKNETL